MNLYIFTSCSAKRRVRLKNYISVQESTASRALFATRTCIASQNSTHCTSDYRRLLFSKTLSIALKLFFLASSMRIFPSAEHAQLQYKLPKVVQFRPVDTDDSVLVQRIVKYFQCFSITKSNNYDLLVFNQ